MRIRHGAWWAAPAQGDVDIGANKLKTTDLLLKQETSSIFSLRNVGDTAYTGLYLLDLSPFGSINFQTDASKLRAPNADGNTLWFETRDTGIGLVEIGRLVGAADPYFQIGRDDTGVGTAAVTDMLVLQAGAGANNEAANFGLGISLRIGNAASEVEERGRIDLVLVTATDASEDSRINFYTQLAGAANLAFYVDQGGQLYADLAGGAGNVTLFDDQDDALLLRQSFSERRLDILEGLGIAHRKNSGSGWMLALQPMLYLLAGGIYQTRQMLEDRLKALETRLQRIET